MLSWCGLGCAARGAGIAPALMPEDAGMGSVEASALFLVVLSCELLRGSGKRVVAERTGCFSCPSPARERHELPRNSPMFVLSRG